MSKAHAAPYPEKTILTPPRPGLPPEGSYALFSEDSCPPYNYLA